MQPPMQELIGFLADTQAADQILEGKFQPPEGTDIYTQKMIKELKMPDSIRNQPTTNPSISTQEHIDSHGFELAPTLGKNQYQDNGTIKTKHFALESDNNSTQESTTTPSNSNNS